jgi:hypothetical protein
MAATAREPTPDPDPTATGLRVLAALEEGRRLAIEAKRQRAARVRLLVLAASRRDEQRGHPSRGRAGRISRDLHGVVTRRHVQRILDTLSCVSNSRA